MWGIDGGGSSTRGIALKPKEEWGPVASAGASNILVVGQEAAFSAVDRVLAELEPESNGSGVAGLAGADRPAVFSAWQEFFRQRQLSRVWIVGDYWLPWGAYTGGRDGAVAILGTGSLFFSVWEGRLLRAGGYGWKIGDPGSGLLLGQQALRAAAQSLEGSGPPSALGAAALEFFGARDLPALLNTLYAPDMPWRHVADFAPAVFREAASGDSASAGLLAAEARSIVRCLQLMPPGDRGLGPLTVGLSGGLAAAWLPYLEPLLAQEGSVSVSIVKELPVQGAARLAALWEQERRPYNCEQ